MTDANGVVDAETHQRINVFLDACTRNADMLSDTWRTTIQVKGARYSIADLNSMRRPGSSVSLHVIGHHQFSDAGALDMSDPLHVELLQLGDSPIGDPHLDIVVAGQRVSSHYLKDIPVAARIIRQLDSRGISKPTILEVGGGMGLLGFALRQYYGDDLTLVMADIPETLEYQAYLLTRSFPDAQATFRPDETPVALLPGGLNFVNAYALPGQGYDLDVFINCNSMAEMSEDTANLYLRYAQTHLRDEGFIFFMNTFGIATSSARAASEYQFGPGWDIAEWFVTDSYTYANPTEFFASFVLQRHRSASETLLRAKLRACFNATAFDYAVPGTQLMESIVGRQELSSTALIDRSWSRTELIDDATFARLAEYPVLPFQLTRDLPASSELGSWPQACGTAIRRFQRGLIRLMDSHTEEHQVNPADTLGEITNDLAALASSPAGRSSEFYSAYAALALAALGDHETSRSLVAKNLSESRHPVWGLRGAWIAQQLETEWLADACLTNALKSEISPSWLPMASVLLSHSGRHGESERALEDAYSTAISRHDVELMNTVFRTHCVLGDAQKSKELWEGARASFEKHAPSTSLFAGGLSDLLLSGLRFATPGSEVRKSLNEAVEHCLQSRGGSISNIGLFAAIDRLEDAHQLATDIEEQTTEDYYFQGRLAAAYLDLDDVAAARRCAQRSSRLRPNNPRHGRFLGLMFFERGLYPDTTSFLEPACTLTPEDLITRGLLSFSQLPETSKESGQFGSAGRVTWMFQRDQAFFYPYGPKPR